MPRRCPKCGGEADPRCKACARQRVNDFRIRMLARREVVPPDQQKCYQCGETKSKDHFVLDLSRKSGLSSLCKECKKEYDVRRISEKFKSRSKVVPPDTAKCCFCKQVKASSEFHKCISKPNGLAPKCKACVYIYDHFIRDKARQLESGKRWKANNPEKHADSNRRLKAKHPEWARNSTHRRRVRSLFSAGSITAAEWKRLCKKYGNKCLCCGAEGTQLTMDHVVPLALGGGHVLSNIQPLCKKCNCRKSARFIDYRPGRKGVHEFQTFLQYPA